MTLKALPYVYKITHKITKQFYIGSRVANKAQANLDLGFTYFTSSKYVKKLGFSNFEIVWIEEFDNPNVAYKFEQLIIFELLKDPLCLNKVCHFGKPRWNNINIKHSSDALRKMSAYAKNRTDEHTHNLSNSLKGRKTWNKGKTMSEEYCNIIKISKSHVSEETRHKQSIAQKKRMSIKENNPMYNKKHSKESLIKMSRSKKNISEETRDKMIKSANNRHKIMCVYCNKYFSPCMLSRWHGEKCKSK